MKLLLALALTFATHAAFAAPVVSDTGSEEGTAATLPNELAIRGVTFPADSINARIEVFDGTTTQTASIASGGAKDVIFSGLPFAPAEYIVNFIVDFPTTGTRAILTQRKMATRDPLELMYTSALIEELKASQGFNAGQQRTLAMRLHRQRLQRELASLQRRAAELTQQIQALTP
jgi:hypothetical protein